MLLYLRVWHLHLTTQTLVRFAEKGNKTMIKILPVCKGALNIVCVTETGELEVQPLPSWGQTCFELQLSRCRRQLATAHRYPSLPLPSSGYHHLTSARRTRYAIPWKSRWKNPTRKSALVNPCCFGRREGARDWSCRRMWPLAWSSWKWWHFTPAQDSIPEHSPRLPQTDRKAALPKKEIIWDFFAPWIG